MKYEDIKTPEELAEFMNNNINYGFVDDNGKVYDSSNEEEFEEGCKTKWKLSSPKRLIEVGYGNCFDQVELERDWFTRNGYEVKTYFILFELDYENTYSMHTYLVYKDKDGYFYFEHSDATNRGIYKFNSYNSAIKYQKNNHIEYNKRFNPVGDDELKKLHIYEYEKPKYGSSNYEFIDFILDEGIIKDV